MIRLVSGHDEVILTVQKELEGGLPPNSVTGLATRLGELAIGIPQRVPILFSGARLFRVRKMEAKPHAVHEVGAPPVGVASIGRLNEQGQRILYVADSPATAFAEARSAPGDYCLSEWNVNVAKLALANGGLTSEMLSERFPEIVGDSGVAVAGVEEERVLRLFRQIYTLSVTDDGRLYRWSIACGLANGFAHMLERTETKEVDGSTEWEGRYPFSGLAYPSVRTGRPSVNYALNDVGMTKVDLKQIQWTRLSANGSYTRLDFADAWERDGAIKWLNRPANVLLDPGQAARATKMAEAIWEFEMLDGSVPRFG